MRCKGRATILILALAAAWAPSAGAQELALTFGRFLGDDVLDSAPIFEAPDKLGFADSGIYGARFSIGALVVDFEAAALYTPTNLLAGTPLELNSSATYLEAAARVKIFPGPVAPFLAGGVGYHRISWGLTGSSSYGTLGYNLGAGLAFGLGKFGIRGDLRDHITPLRVDSIDPAVVEHLGMTKDVTVHNFELSVALTISL